jgi:hypothetical protein
VGFQGGLSNRSALSECRGVCDTAPSIEFSQLPDAAGRLTDDATREHLTRFLNQFAKWIARWQ